MFVIEFDSPRYQIFIFSFIHISAEIPAYNVPQHVCHQSAKRCNCIPGRNRKSALNARNLEWKLRVLLIKCNPCCIRKNAISGGVHILICTTYSAWSHVYEMHTPCDPACSCASTGANISYNWPMPWLDSWFKVEVQFAVCVILFPPFDLLF